MRDAANPGDVFELEIARKGVGSDRGGAQTRRGIDGVGRRRARPGGPLRRDEGARARWQREPASGDLLGGLGATIGGWTIYWGDLSVGGGICAPASPPSGPAMTGGDSPPPQQQQRAQMMMQTQQQMMGMGATGMGVPGMGATGMGVPGMGATGMGMPGMGATGMGATGMGVPGMVMPGMGRDGYAGLGASQMGPGIVFAASPPSSPKIGTLASAGRRPAHQTP